MLDLPSCSSYDLYLQKPELMAKERDGQAKTPQGWNDIRMFQPFSDETKRYTEILLCFVMIASVCIFLIYTISGFLNT